MSKFIPAHSKTRKWVLSAPSISQGKAMNGSSLPLVPGNKPGIVSNTASKAIVASWRTVTLPWYLTLKWLSWCAAVIIQFFSLLGATPQGYVPLPKVRELNSIIEHMHTREDLYRKTIRVIAVDFGQPSCKSYCSCTTPSYQRSSFVCNAAAPLFWYQLCFKHMWLCLFLLLQGTNAETAAKSPTGT